MLGDDGYEVVEISEDEDLMLDGPPSPIRPPSCELQDEAYRTSNESANLPNSPMNVTSPSASAVLRPSSVPVEAPVHENIFSGRRSVPVSTTQSGADNLHKETSRFRQNSSSSSSLASLPTLAASPIRSFFDNGAITNVDDFLRLMTDSGIKCILCDDVEVPGRELLKHVCERHFLGYRPFKCNQCDFTAGHTMLLLVMHAIEFRHQGIVVVRERNENIEAVIEIIYLNSLETRGRNDSEKNMMVERLLDATRALYRRREIPMAPERQPRSSSPNLNDDHETFLKKIKTEFSIPIPLPSPSTNGFDETPTLQNSPLVEQGAPSAELPISPIVPIPSADYQCLDAITPPPVLSVGVIDDNPPPDQVASMDTTEPFQPADAEPIGFNHFCPDQSINDMGGASARCETISPIDRSPPPPVLTPEGNADVGENSGIDRASPIIESTKFGPVKPLPAATKLSCDFCPIKVYNLMHLKDHTLKVHTGGYVLFRCGECSYSNWRKREIRDHMKEHGLDGGSIAPVKPTAEQRIQLEKLKDSFDTKGIVSEDLKLVLGISN